MMRFCLGNSLANHRRCQILEPMCGLMRRIEQKNCSGDDTGDFELRRGFI